MANIPVRQIKQQTCVELLSLTDHSSAVQHNKPTIHSQSSTSLNNSNKTPPNVKLLQFTWTCSKGSGPFFLFFIFFKVVPISSTTTYTVLWCVWVLHLFSENWTWGESGVTSIVITARLTTTAKLCDSNTRIFPASLLVAPACQTNTHAHSHAPTQKHARNASRTHTHTHTHAHAGSVGWKCSWRDERAGEGCRWEQSEVPRGRPPPLPPVLLRVTLSAPLTVWRPWSWCEAWPGGTEAGSSWTPSCLEPTWAGRQELAGQTDRRLHTVLLGPFPP